MVYNLKKTVVLVGMMGSGKTAVGTALARKLAVPLLDSDQEIQKAANMDIDEIFERDGEPFFRDREREVISRLLDEAKGVLSTGGGAFMSPGNQAMIAQKGVAVWLRADIELLWSRVRHKTTRPLLRTDNPKKTLIEIYGTREQKYAEADLVVDAKESYSIEEMADKVIAALLTRPDVLEIVK